MNSITEKKCSKCKEVKEISCFYYHTSLHRYRSQCKDCLKNEDKQRYRENKENINKRHKKYYENNKESLAEATKRYIKNNIERVKEYHQKYYANNKALMNEKSKEWYRKNIELRTRQISEWHKNNPLTPEKSRTYNNRRRCRKINAEGSFTVKEWKDLCNKYGNKCLNCGINGTMTIDHIVPLSKGGTNWISNIQPLCRSCNAKKHTDIIDYRKNK